jgi:hypothetical protein
MAGTSFEIVVLSSSPPPYYASSSPLNGSPRSPPRRVTMPASPLPALSPPVSPHKNIAGASVGSRKAAIPPDAIRGFATVGSLIRSEHFAQHEDISERQNAQLREGSTEGTRDVFAAKKKPKKRIATASVEDGDSKPKPKPRKSMADKDMTARDPELRLPAPKISPYFPPDIADAPVQGESADAAPKLTKSGKPRKPRAKKEKAEGDAEPKPKKTRVTKPKAGAKGAGKSQREDACIASAYLGEGADGSTTPRLATLLSETNHDLVEEDVSVWELPQSPQPRKKRAPRQKLPDTVAGGLDLQEAVSRRRDWTPPRDTAIASAFTDSVGKENKQTELDADNGNFTHMISNFTYAQPPSMPTTVTTTTSITETIATTKRRRVEVSIPSQF